MKHEINKLEEMLKNLKQLKAELECAKIEIIDGKVVVKVEAKEENSSQTNTNQSPSETAR